MKSKYYYTIMMKTYGLPDYFNKDLSEEDDCFIFDTEREANECLKSIFNNEQKFLKSLGFKKPQSKSRFLVFSIKALVE